MSHFSVAVITDQEPTNGLLTEILQPWHEFECTGTDDEYVKDIELQGEARAEYEKDTATLVIRHPDGRLNYAFNEEGNYKEEYQEYYQYWDGGFSKELRLPEGYEEVNNLPAKDFQTFAQWAREWYGMKSPLTVDAAPDLEGDHKYGYIVVDEVGEVVKIVQRTNPDKRWDWWTVGGRYSDRLLDKEGNWHDSLRRGDIDLERMRSENLQTRVAAMEDILERLSDEHKVSREELMAAWRKHVEAGGWDALYKRFQADTEKPESIRWPDWVKAQEDDPSHNAVRYDLTSSFRGMFSPIDVPDTASDPIAWATNPPALSTFAFVRDGQWSEVGKMGWFACVSDKVNEIDWEREFDKMIAELPDDAYITYVDCHI